MLQVITLPGTCSIAIFDAKYSLYNVLCDECLSLNKEGDYVRKWLVTAQEKYYPSFDIGFVDASILYPQLKITLTGKKYDYIIS